MRVVAFLLVCALAALTDERGGRVPNWLTLPGVAWGAWLGAGPAAAAAALVLAVVARARWGFGGGDAKLAAALLAIWPLGGALAVLLAVAHARARPRALYVPIGLRVLAGAVVAAVGIS